MLIFYGIVVVIFVIVCILLCILVLIQSDKGGGISGAIGGSLSGASTLLGTQDTANILTRGTTIFAVAYMVLCIVLSLGLTRLAATKQEESLLKKRAETGVESFEPSSALDFKGEELPTEGVEGKTEPPPAPIKGEKLPE